MGNPNQCPQCYTVNTDDSVYCSKCGSALEEKQETLSYTPDQQVYIKDEPRFLPGDSFGDRYKIIEEIGRGGMGRVYKAEDKELKTTVALKVIRQKYAADPSFVEKLKRETLLGRSITQENVIRIHDIGEIEGTKYISMDYIKGQSLKELITTSGKLTVETAVYISKQIAKALQAAHKKGIVHRDLKPQNIMIDKNGNAYAMDFGIAKVIEEQEFPAKKVIAGTPQYLSPEQAKGDKADQKSDIYALGLIMYEMLTGKPVFLAQDKDEYIKKHIYQKPTPPSKINPRIIPSLEKVILKCLEKSRNNRYASLNEILIDLEKIEKASKSFQQRMKRRALPISYAVCAVALVIIASILIRTQIIKKSEIQSALTERRFALAVLNFENNTGDEKLDYMQKAIPSLITYDLLQSKYIRPLTSDRLLAIQRELNLSNATSYSRDDLEKVASRSGASHILIGSYFQANDHIRINTMIHDANNWDLVGTPMMEGNDINTMVDDLTMKIKADFKLPKDLIASDIDEDVGKITTESPEALQHYLEGVRLYIDGNFQESNEEFKKAIKIDPEFAMAYKQIANNYQYIGNMDKSLVFLDKALSLLDRVSLRERFLIQGYKSLILSHNPSEAIQYYQELLELYPDDVTANVYLGSTYRNLEEWDLTVEVFKKVTEIENRNELGYVNLYNAYKALGLYDMARQVLLENQHVFISQSRVRRYSGLVDLIQNKLDSALQNARESVTIDPENYRGQLFIGRVYLILKDFSQAKNAIDQVIKSDDVYEKMGGLFWRAQLNLILGKFGQSLEDAKQALQLAQKHDEQQGEIDYLYLSAYLNLRMGNYAQALEASDQARRNAHKHFMAQDYLMASYLHGLICIKAGAIKKAEEIAELIKPYIEETQCKKYKRYYHLLRGDIYLAEMQAILGIDSYEAALSLLYEEMAQDDEHALFLEAIALAEDQYGDIDKAQKHYENILSLTTGRMWWGDIYALSYYRLAKIYQKKEWREKATENYEEFLKLWKDADPGISEINDAREQLAQLR